MNKLVLFALLLNARALMCAESPVVSSIMDFSGGLNDNTPAIYLKSNESPDLMNVVVDDPVGALRQRNGYFRCGDTPSGNTATAMYEFSKKDGSRRLILSDNISIWETADCVNFTTITTGLSANDVPSFKTIRDYLWIVNGTTHPIVWNGTTATVLDGTGSKPEPPNGKYIEFWKDRVWIGRTATEPSSIWFSELTDSTGTVLDPVTSTAAWDMSYLNTFYIGREDGSPIYGMKVYRDNLFAFKDTGISRIIFESEFDAEIVKPVTTVGCRFNDTIVEMDDGLLYFMGTDGIYRYNGAAVDRISDNIQNTWNKYKQPAGYEKFDIWDTDSDFNNGTYSNTSTGVVSAALALYADTDARLVDDFSGTLSKWTSSGDDYWQIDNGRAIFWGTASNPTGTGYLWSSTTSLNYGNWKIDIQVIDGNSSADYDQAKYFFIADSTNVSTVNGYFFGLKNNGPCVVASNYCPGKATIGKMTNGVESIVAYNTFNSSITVYGTDGAAKHECKGLKINITNDGVITTTTGTYSGSAGCDITYTIPSFVQGRSVYNIIWAKGVIYKSYTEGKLYASGADNIYTPGWYRSPGIYTSEAANAGTSLSQWRTFDADESLNGGSIAYQIRTATSSATLANAGYSTILPGNIISTQTADTWYQWKTTLTCGTGCTDTPDIDNVSLNWREGDSTIARLAALRYKSRYWLTGSTTASNAYNDQVIVKSKSPMNSFVPHNLSISAFTVWNGNLYGAISNTDDIVRLDYGDNDGGSAISSYWTSRDEVYGPPYFMKRIGEVVVDYKKSDNNALTIGLSSDNGTTYTDRTLDVSTSLYDRNIKRFNYNMPQSLNFRTKISNSLLDQGYTIYGVHTFGNVYDFKGN